MYMQLEYAALDAAVLIHIFRHVRGHTQPAAAGVSDGHTKIEWKSYIVWKSLTLSMDFFGGGVVNHV